MTMRSWTPPRPTCSPSTRRKSLLRISQDTRAPKSVPMTDVLVPQLTAEESREDLAVPWCDAAL